MDKREQSKDTGKLTNYQYGTEKDQRTPHTNGKGLLGKGASVTSENDTI
ncbi:hypothetical protein ACFOU2_21065 [Bacillus songklensis]|uniref:YpzG-like protein n=1 Tax=Bacillus songklensis TaxID=1069116 RepID=A0ABV8B8U2_9BACI